MAVPVNIYVAASGGAPIQGVAVNIYDPDQALDLAGSAQTDAEGLAAFLLPGADPAKAYEVRLFKLGVIFGGLKHVSVQEPLPNGATSAYNSFDVTGILTTLPVATDPRVCRCTGRFVDFSNRPIAGATVRILARAEPGYQVPKVVDGNMVSAELANLKTDGSGMVSVDLHRGGEYYVTYSGEVDTLWNFKVPDAPSANLIELIHPQPASTVWDDAVAPGGVVSVPVDFALLVPLTLIFSNADRKNTGLPSWITLTSSNPSVATVALTDGAALITGVAPGTVEISVDVAVDSYPSRIPLSSVPPNPLTVTVPP